MVIVGAFFVCPGSDDAPGLLGARLCRPIWADILCDMDTAHIIRQQMNSQGSSINALARDTLIPRVTLQRKLNGHADFTITEARRIAEALGVEVSVLVVPQTGEADQ